MLSSEEMKVLVIKMGQSVPSSLIQNLLEVKFLSPGIPLLVMLNSVRIYLPRISFILFLCFCFLPLFYVPFAVKNAKVDYCIEVFCQILFTENLIFFCFLAPVLRSIAAKNTKADCVEVLIFPDWFPYTSNRHINTWLWQNYISFPSTSLINTWS